MRISDWSSDVCSSDLDAGAMVGHQHYMAAIARITAAVREREAKVAILRDTPAHAIGGGLFARGRAAVADAVRPRHEVQALRALAHRPPLDRAGFGFLTRRPGRQQESDPFRIFVRAIGKKS